MSELEAGVEPARALQQAFDQAFAVAPAEIEHGLQACLQIRVAGRPFALRIAELVRLEAVGKIVPLPAQTVGLLGLAGIQGRVTPIYDLAQFVGIPSTSSVCRWIAVCGATERVGLAFEMVEGYVQVAPHELLEWRADGAASSVATDIVPTAIQAAGLVRPLLHLPTLLAELQQRIQ